MLCHVPAACPTCPIAHPLLPTSAHTWLQDAPLEFVVAHVLGKGARSGAPPVLTKRQFLSLAHVAEVAQVRGWCVRGCVATEQCQSWAQSHKARQPAPLAQPLPVSCCAGQGVRPGDRRGRAAQPGVCCGQ